MSPVKARPEAERFWPHVDKSGGPEACWPWTRSFYKTTGYGQFTHAGKVKTTAHRWVYQATHGPIPDGLYVDHECHNRDLTCPGGRTCLHRRCCNPAHLTVKDSDANVKASPNSNHRKTHCPRDHEYTEANTYVQASGSRACRECARLRQQPHWPSTLRERARA